MQLKWKQWQPVIYKTKVELIVYPQDHGSESSSTDNWGSENIKQLATEETISVLSRIL